jgi:hypothetical protein
VAGAPTDAVGVFEMLSTTARGISGALGGVPLRWLAAAHTGHTPGNDLLGLPEGEEASVGVAGVARTLNPSGVQSTKGQGKGDA